MDAELRYVASAELRYVASAETKRDCPIRGHVTLDKCNVS